MRLAGCVLLVYALVGWGAASATATLPIGAQFRVSNTGSDGDPAFGASGASVAYNPQANEYLVVWSGDGLATNNELEVFGQRVSATGTELGGDFRISTTGTDGDANREATDPAVAFNPQANEYLVVWRADGLPTDDELEVFGQRVSATGTELGGDFRISTTGTDGDAARDVENPAVAYGAQAGEFLVVWNGDGLATDNEHEVFGQRLAGAGAELGGDFRISTTGTDGDANRDATKPSVTASSPANEYLVAWDADGLATDNEFEIFRQRLSATGAELGPDVRISTTGTDGDASHDAARPSVAHSPQANEYLVAWEADGLPTVGELELFGQRLSAAAVELGGDFRISTTGTDGDANRDAQAASVASNSQSNEYLVAWHEDGLATDDELELFGQRLSASGAELGGDFRISTTGSDGDAAREALAASVAYNPQANEYLVAWEADGLAVDNDQEIFARRSGGADTVAPVVSGLALSRKRFRVGPRRTALAAKRKRRAKAGTTIRYRLSENATVTFRIERALRGRLKRVRGKRRCVKSTPRLVRSRAKRCKRHRPAGRLTRKASTGLNKLAFSGRVGRRALRPGKHRLTLQATDAAGNGSRAIARNFTIVRR